MKLGFLGNVNIKVFDKSGKLKHDVTVKNQILTQGFAELATQLISDSLTIEFLEGIGIGWGSGANTPFSLSQTALQGANTYFEASVNTQPALTVLNMVATFGPGEPSGASFPISIEEAGLVYDPGVTDFLFSRTVFGAIPKDDSDTVIVQWQYSLTEGP